MLPLRHSDVGVRVHTKKYKSSFTHALFNTELRPFDGHSEASDTILLPTESAVAFGIMYNS